MTIYTENPPFVIKEKLYVVQQFPFQLALLYSPRCYAMRIFHKGVSILRNNAGKIAFEHDAIQTEIYFNFDLNMFHENILQAVLQNCRQFVKVLVSEIVYFHGESLPYVWTCHYDDVICEIRNFATDCQQFASFLVGI